jgi:hypothetical protein
MRSSIISSVVSGFIALSMAACSGAGQEPVDQSAQAEHAGLTAPTTAPAASGSAAPVADNDGEHHMRGHGAPDPAMIVKRFDKNGDGVLQVSELPEQMQKFMAKADTNNDGVLSIDELKAGEAKMKAEHMAKVDTNHDGTISPEERKAAFEKFAQERFAKLDKNGDGALTKDEVGDKRWERLSVADADKNGSVTQDEIRQAVASGALKFPHHGFRGHGGHHGGGGERNEQTPAPAADPSAASAPMGT